MKHKIGTESPILELQRYRIFDVFDAIPRSCSRAIGHARDIVGQRIIIDERRDTGCLTISQQLDQIALDLIPTRHTALETRTDLDELRRQDRRNRMDRASAQVIAEDVRDESLLGLSLDENE